MPLLRANKACLEHIVRQASHIAGCSFPSIASCYDTLLCHRASKILVDSSHPANHLFELLPSGRRYKAIKAKTRQFRLSFFPLVGATRPLRPRLASLGLASSLRLFGSCSPFFRCLDTCLFCRSDCRLVVCYTALPGHVPMYFIG